MAGLPLPTVAGGATGTGVWTDINSLAGLKAKAEANGSAALPAVAKQFEAVFVEMLIHSMRQANFGGGIFDSQEMQQWQGIFDQQIALSLANDGSGIGIATMLERQLGRSGTGAKPGAATALTAQERATRTVDGTAPMPIAQAPVALLGGIASRAERGIEAMERWARGAAQAVGGTTFAGPDDFVRRLAPYAEKAAQALGVSVRAVLAQAALETDWGRHLPERADGQSSHNLFGIKAGPGWTGPAATASTLEYVNGQAVRIAAAFRAYAGPAQAFVDYVKTLAGNPRYAAALGNGGDVAAFAGALTRAGYATDPAYAGKLTALAGSAEMTHALELVKNSADRPIP
ncbi:MAG TPA: flagellar assembly peptidoglycan hydrolase FlgJ [Rhodanobacteraceae bacterium]|nr:flagellar assembly peptidoglycan hydrolase FlgJ [Rhodanobacteraceae bacterium]